MTSPTPTRRRLPVALMVLALALGLAGLTSCSSDDESDPVARSVVEPAAAPSHDHAALVEDLSTPSQLALHDAMRTLWAQHMEWTYAAIAAFAVDSPGFEATAERLLQNQTDIGDAIKPFYGDEAGAALTELLRAHITTVVDLLVAAKAGDDPAYKKAAKAVYANADQIADFLAKANPESWDKADMRSMMKGHIDQTVVYASDQLTGEYADSIVAYETAEGHMLEMADLLTAGLVEAFPDRFVD